ncbi:MAG: HEAT repeat domain-containing protein [Candidatus Heimdallarchaeota archaeon]|nr:HEAT repeat domain-containing protein [Candidatus Heimdallarchaeota archaeon]
MNQKEKIDSLIIQLKSSDVEQRQEAAWSLKEFAEDRIKEVELAIPALQSAISDDDWVVRKMSILALGELNVKEEIPKFIEFLNDSEPEVRVGAAQSLGIMKAKHAVPYLIKTLDDPADIVRQVTIWALGLIGEDASEAVPKLIAILQKLDTMGIVEENNLAAWALGQIGDKSAVDPLLNELKKATYHEKKFNLACILSKLEGINGVGYAELQRMKESNELTEYELDSFNNLLEELTISKQK